MAKWKSTCGVGRGDSKFQRDYLLRRGLVKPASPVDDELRQLRGVVECCEFLIPVAQAAARSGNASELVATWLKALAVISRRKIASGGMGAMAPMETLGGEPDQPRTQANANGLGDEAAQARPDSPTRK